ncbi:MAG TPA: 50S ribosomal protein L30 [Cytophagales bacterium]|nr:50S ribosomal protein L30 [Cytophagales bacterium]
MSKVRITQSKSVIGQQNRQKLTVKALGLGKINSSVEVELTPQIKGMIDKVKHIVTVNEL